jgi:heme-degrading monooxygenase HmoA
MIIQIVKFESALSEEEVMATAKEREEQFRALPGLLQKYYFKVGESNQYGGIYIWDSLESLRSYRESDLAASIAEAYKAVGPPNIEILDGLFQLRE